MALLKENLVYLYVKAGVTVGGTEIVGDWWMADVALLACALNRFVQQVLNAALIVVQQTTHGPSRSAT